MHRHALRRPGSRSRRSCARAGRGSSAGSHTPLRPSTRPASTPEVGADADQRLLDAAHVRDDVDRAGQPHDRVADELPRAVPGDLAAAVDVDAPGCRRSAARAARSGCRRCRRAGAPAAARCPARCRRRPRRAGRAAAARPARSRPGRRRSRPDDVAPDRAGRRVRRRGRRRGGRRAVMRVSLRRGRPSAAVPVGRRGARRGVVRRSGQRCRDRCRTIATSAAPQRLDVVAPRPRRSPRPPRRRWRAGRCAGPDSVRRDDDAAAVRVVAVPLDVAGALQALDGAAHRLVLDLHGGRELALGQRPASRARAGRRGWRG